MVRGGSYFNGAANCRCTNRNGNRPDNRNDNIGFRLVGVLQLTGCWMASTEQASDRFPIRDRDEKVASEATRAVILVALGEGFTVKF